MLVAASDLNTDDRIKMMFLSWTAICPETGAYLIASRGNPKAGNATKYILIVPQSRPENIFAYGPHDWNRKGFRAWTVKEAIEIGNKKLLEILEKRNAKK